MLLSAEQVTKLYGDRILLDRVSFSLDRGDKVGVIGVNGSRKSTLLRLLAGAEERTAEQSSGNQTYAWSI